MLEEDPPPASGVHPPSPGPSLGGTVGGPWLSLPVHGLTPGPSPGTVPPSAGTPAPHVRPPRGWGCTRQDRAETLGGRGRSRPLGERRERPRLPAPAAVVGTPHPSPPPSLPLGGFFVSVVPFLFYSLSPFSQRNKGLEIAGPLVFVTRWRRGHHLRAPALRFCLARTDWTCHTPCPVSEEDALGSPWECPRPQGPVES